MEKGKRPFEPFRRKESAMFGITKYLEPKNYYPESWSLFRELERQFNPFFGDVFRPLNYETMGSEIHEGENDYLLLCAVPGYEKEEISVEFKNNELTVTAEHLETYEEENEKGEKIEKKRPTSSMSTSFRVSNDIDTEKAGVELKNGMLKIILPKKPETKPRKIEIK
jgi:HSP20 family protein